MNTLSLNLKVYDLFKAYTLASHDKAIYFNIAVTSELVQLLAISVLYSNGPS